MMSENEYLIFHRCDRRYNRSTITIKRADHAAMVAEQAKRLGVKQLAAGVFYAKGDTEAAMQNIERLLRAVNA